MAELASEPRPGDPRPGPEGLHYPNGILIVEDEAEPGPRAADQPAGQAVRGADRGHRPGGAGPGREPPAGRDHPRPGPARHRRHRGDRRTAPVVPRADHRAVRPDQSRRQDRRAGRRRRRLRDQAVRDGRTARPAAGRAAPRRRRDCGSGPASRAGPIASAAGWSTSPRTRSGARPGTGTGTRTRTGTGTGTAAEAATLRLTPTEWRILEILLRRPGQLVGSAQILTGVWGPGFQQRTNYLRFHMARLRRKLEDNPARPRHLLTEPGMGYRYQP